MAFSFLDPFLGPLFRLPSFLALLIFSLLVSLLITLIYKYTTNQSLMKQLKGEIKEFQKEMKELKDKPGEVMRVQKEAMKTNLKYMSMSMKSTLITFIPIIFIFGWMNTHLAFEPAYADRLVKTAVKDSDIKSLEINYQKHIVLNLLGWKMGWLAVYIILSIAFSLGLRKLMKVY